MINEKMMDSERWLEEHGDALFRYALMRLPDREAAEDVVQETFLAALKARESYSGQASERTWLTEFSSTRFSIATASSTGNGTPCKRRRTNG